MQVMPAWDGNKLVLKYEPKEADSVGKPQTHTREIVGEELILVWFAKWLFWTSICCSV